MVNPYMSEFLTCLQMHCPVASLQICDSCTVPSLEQRHASQPLGLEEVRLKKLGLHRSHLSPATLALQLHCPATFPGIPSFCQQRENQMKTVTMQKKYLQVDG